MNLSIQRRVPDCWKSALVIPLLKKFGLELIFKNFRPVNNLNSVAKVVKKAVTAQLLTHSTINVPLSVNQSWYRAFHSMENALVKVQSDIPMAMDQQEGSLLVLSDLNATFDTSILENEYGVISNA